MIDEDDENIVKAPFTDEQVRILNKSQEMGYQHPYTCQCSGENILIATNAGWVCPKKCGYTQDWAHKFSLNEEHINLMKHLFASKISMEIDDYTAFVDSLPEEKRALIVNVFSLFWKTLLVDRERAEKMLDDINEMRAG
jgi:hypothetical protein